MILLIISLIILSLFIYAVVIRPRIRDKAWAKPFFEFIEPIERRLFLKSEQILTARLTMFTGALLTVLTQTQALDITPLMPYVPDAYEPLLRLVWNAQPLMITLLGWVQECQRKDTTKPIDIVALSTEAKADPVVAEAVAKVEEAVAVAKSTVADATSGVK